MLNEDLWETFEWQSVYARTQALLDRADGAFDFAHMAIGWDDVDFDGLKFLANTFELMVPVNIAHIETSGLVHRDDGARILDDHWFSAIRDLSEAGAVSESARDGVVEW